MAEQDYIHMPTLEEYSERFKRFFKFKRSEDGILEVRMHTFEGPTRWSYQMHHAISELWTAVGHDTKNEVLIFTATGDQWIFGVDADSFREVEESPDDVQRFNIQIYDTLKVVENFVNDIEIPTICALTGQGIHWEMAMMSDITLCTPDFVLQDDHFVHGGGHVPGDGMNFSYRVCLGQKRAAYMAYMEPKIDAETALAWGLLNEIVEHDQLIPRAYEIARHIMKTGRAVRRLTHELVMRPWKRALQDDERVHVLAEMYAVQLQATRHNFDKVVADFTGDRPQHTK